MMTILHNYIALLFNNTGGEKLMKQILLKKITGNYHKKNLSLLIRLRPSFVVP